MVLTERQQQDLHVAILEYLRDAGPAFERAAEAFELDAGLTGQGVPKATALLEKKWTSVVRLQKKVLELEERLAAAEAELKAARLGGGVGDVGLLSRSRVGSTEPGARNLPRAPAVRTLVGHRGGITCLTTHPVYGLLVSGSEDATIKTWDLETGEYERTLKGHTNAVQALAFNRTGALLASCSSDLSIKLWDFGPNSGGSNGQECLRTLRGHDHNISGLVFLPQGDQLVSCSRDKTLKVWEAASGFCVKTLTGHTDWVRCLAASADGSLLASGGSDQSVIVWNVATGTATLTLREHTHVVESVAFPPPGAGDVRVSGAGAGADVAAATPEKPAGKGSTDDGGGSDDKENASAGSGSGSGSLVSTTPRQRRMGGGGEKGGGGAPYLVSGGRDKTVRVWDLATGLCLMAFAEHENWVRDVLVHPSGLYALSCSDDRSIRVLDLAKGRCLRTLADAHAQFVTALAQHPTLPYLASGGVDREIRVWECR